MYAEVLIEYGVKSLDKSFTYIIPDSLKEILKVGMKVIIPFGKKNINGFVTNIKNEFKDDYELKEIIDVVDKELVLNNEMLEMGKFLQEKTLCSLITAYKTMLAKKIGAKPISTGNPRLLYEQNSLESDMTEVNIAQDYPVEGVV